MLAATVIREPFEDDQHDQVADCREHQDEFGKGVQIELLNLPSFKFIDHLQDNAKAHMNEGHHHTDFHFQRILEIHSVFGHAPLPFDDAQIFTINNLHSEKLIIDCSAVDAHKGHKVKY